MRMTSWLLARTPMTARRFSSPRARSSSWVRRAARARVRVVSPWMASRYSAARRIRARRESEEEARRRLWARPMSSGVRTTAAPRTAAGTGSTAAPSRTRHRAGARAAATVGARKVCRYRATRSAPSVSRLTVDPVRWLVVWAGPRSRRWSRTRRRRAASCVAAEPQAVAWTAACRRAQAVAAAPAWASRPARWVEEGVRRSPTARPRHTSAQVSARAARAVMVKAATPARLPAGVATEGGRVPRRRGRGAGVASSRGSLEAVMCVLCRLRGAWSRYWSVGGRRSGKDLGVPSFGIIMN